MILMKYSGMTVFLWFIVSAICLHFECHGCNVESPSKTTRLSASSADISFAEFDRELSKCGWDHVVVVTEERRCEDLASQLSLFLVKMSKIITIHQTNVQDFVDFVYKEYVEKHHTNFILISDNQGLFEDVQSLFYNHSRHRMAAFPHRSKWIMLDNWSHQSHRWTLQNSVLDNVALVSLRDVTITNIRTLVWGKHRQREWQPIKMDRNDQQCSIFPNVKHHLNGRPLTLAVSEFYHGIIISNNSAQRRQYSGLFVDVARQLHTMLNFTIHFTSNTPTYLKFVHSVRNSEADIGLIYFSHIAALQDNLSATYPIFLDNIVVAYVYSDGEPIGYFRFVYDSFGEIVIAVFTAYVGVVVFYQSLFRLHMWIIQNYIDGSGHYTDQQSMNINLTRNSIHVLTENSTGRHNLDMNGKIEHENIFAINLGCQNCKMNFREKATHNLTVHQIAQDDMGIDTTIMRKPKSDLAYSDRFQVSDCIEISHKTTRSQNNCPRFVRFLKMCCSVYNSLPNFHAIEFYGSFFNQSTLIRPKPMSLRVFIFFWCLFALLIQILLIGTLTARFVRPLDKPPFSSVSEVLLSEYTEVGSFMNTEIHNRSKFWYIDGKHWSGELEKFPITFKSSPNEFRTFMEQPGSSKLKVFVYYRKLLEYIKIQSNFKDLYITTDNFQTSLLGFVLPQNSELASMINPAILSLHDAGITAKLEREYLEDCLNSMDRKEEDEGILQNITNFSYCLKFLVLVGFILAATVIVLWFERMAYFVLKYYNIST